MLLAVAAIGFLLLSLVPGDPVVSLFPEAGDARHYAELRARFGLDRPLAQRFSVYLSEILQGNLGQSLAQGRPVVQIIVERVPASLLLASAAMVVALLGIPFGVFLAHCAERQPRIERASFMLVLMATGLPPFLLGLLLILLFAAQLNLLPSQGATSIREAYVGAQRYGDILVHLLLPSITLGVQPLAALARITRARILDILPQDFIRTARAKGLAEPVVLLRHALKNAVSAPISLAALTLGHWIGGAVVTETVFAWPGLGRLSVEAMLARDYPLILGILVFGAALIVLANLVADLLAATLDPRLRHG